MNALRLSFLMLLLAVVVVGCRPRTSKNRTKQNTAQTTKTATPAGMDAKQVMNRTDSAIQRVAAMNYESDLDRPPVATDDGAGARTPWGSSYVPRPNGGDYDTYQNALGSYNAGQYDQAIGSFSQVVVSGKPPELVPNAYYWMGESYYAMQRYQESLPYFEYVTKAGPEYKRTMAFYKLAMASDNLGNRQAANLWYERLRNEYPSSTYAKKLAARGLR